MPEHIHEAALRYLSDESKSIRYGKVSVTLVIQAGKIIRLLRVREETDQVGERSSEQSLT